MDIIVILALQLAVYPTACARFVQLVECVVGGCCTRTKRKTNTTIANTIMILYGIKIYIVDLIFRYFQIFRKIGVDTYACYCYVFFGLVCLVWFVLADIQIERIVIFYCF